MGSGDRPNDATVLNPIRCLNLQDNTLLANCTRLKDVSSPYEMNLLGSYDDFEGLQD